MNKKNYFKILRDELKRRNVKNIDDIIDDYEDLIYQKMKEGMSEEEAVRELGSIEELANSYGEAQPQKGEVDYLKFGLLQLFNLIVGFALVVSLIGIGVGLLGGIAFSIFILVISLINIVNGALISMSALLMLFSIIAGSTFSIGILVILTKLIFILVYNYILYNINIIKTNKLVYKRIKVKKLELITVAISLVVMVTFFASSIAVGRDNWRNYANEMLGEMSYHSGNNREILTNEEEFEFSEEVKVFDIEGVDVVIQKGAQNSVVSNYELMYEIDGDTLRIMEDDFSVDFEIDFNFFEKNPYVIITTTNDLDLIDVSAVDVEIYDVYATSYNIDAVDLDFELNSKKMYEAYDFVLDAVDADIVLNNVEFEEIDIDAVDVNIELIDAFVKSISVNLIDAEIEMYNSEVTTLDVSGVLDVDIELNDSIIDTLKTDDFMGADVEKDSNSRINNYDN